MVVVEMRQIPVVEHRGGVVRQHVADIAGDPFARSARSIRLRRRAARRKIAAVAGIEQHLVPSGKMRNAELPRPGIDLMDVESSRVSTAGSGCPTGWANEETASRPSRPNRPARIRIVPPVYLG